jgi:hypothetical protein
MKTPKQILLESHRATEPQLDRLREEVLATEFGLPAVNPSNSSEGPAVSLSKGRPSRYRNLPTALLQKLWLELIWPSRRAWAGLAAVWVGLAAVYLSTQRPGDPKLPPPNPQMVAAWMQEQQLLAQLLDRPTRVAAKTSPPARPEPVEGPNKSAQWLTDDQTAWV